MVIGGADFHWGFGSCVDGLDGHPADFEAASAVAWADDTDVVVVVVVAVFDLLPGLNTRSESPTTISTTTPMVTNRRTVCLRFAAFCSASRRAWRPTF
jgi:hypothetical protein